MTRSNRFAVGGRILPRLAATGGGCGCESPRQFSGAVPEPRAAALSLPGPRGFLYLLTAPPRGGTYPGGFGCRGLLGAT